MATIIAKTAFREEAMTPLERLQSLDSWVPSSFDENGEFLEVSFEGSEAKEADCDSHTVIPVSRRRNIIKSFSSKLLIPRTKIIKTTEEKENNASIRTSQSKRLKKQDMSKRLSSIKTRVASSMKNKQRGSLTKKFSKKFLKKREKEQRRNTSLHNNSTITFTDSEGEQSISSSQKENVDIAASARNLHRINSQDSDLDLKLSKETTVLFSDQAILSSWPYGDEEPKEQGSSQISSQRTLSVKAVRFEKQLESEKKENEKLDEPLSCQEKKPVKKVFDYKRKTATAHVKSEESYVPPEASKAFDYKRETAKVHGKSEECRVPLEVSQVICIKKRKPALKLSTKQCRNLTFSVIIVLGYFIIRSKLA